MSFQPILPLGGPGGWAYLNRTLARQQAAFTASAPVQRITDHFRANIVKATTAEALVNDRRLLEVALGAFDLGDDINARAFIRKVLEEGTMHEGALATRLSDKRYERLAAAFGYGDLGARVDLPDFAETIISRYEARRFEAAVGEQDNDLRLALNLQSSLGELLENTTGERARWFAVLGSPPLRRVFETALGLPRTFAGVDIDRQHGLLKERSESVFGTADLADFTDDTLREKLIRLFLLRSDSAAANTTQSAISVALTLLSGPGGGTGVVPITLTPLPRH